MSANDSGNPALDVLLGLTEQAGEEYLSSNVIENEGERVTQIRPIAQDGTYPQLFIDMNMAFIIISLMCP